MNIQNWFTQIDFVTKSFHDNFSGLSVEELNWKPDPKTWSVAQNIHHLIVINETYYAAIKSVREGTYVLPWIGKFDFMVNLFGKLLLKSVQPDRKNKTKTFPKWEPSQSKIEADILNLFEKHQAELKALIQSCYDLLEANAVISSPANKNIVYTLKSAFDIIVTHEQRHLRQALELNALRNQNK